MLTTQSLTVRRADFCNCWTDAVHRARLPLAVDDALVRISDGTAPVPSDPNAPASVAFASGQAALRTNRPR